ncbi:MAG: hypothetical protein NTU49_07835 [Gammaproteobacteria bacterium]|nr:hypothetical protein [Gammaproteobacteria bacterium]
MFRRFVDGAATLIQNAATPVGAATTVEVKAPEEPTLKMLRPRYPLNLFNRSTYGTFPLDQIQTQFTPVTPFKA